MTILARISIIIMAAAALVGCVSTSDPVQMGRDTYMISTGARGGIASTSRPIADSVVKAGQFCSSKGLNVEVMNTASSGVQGWTPQDASVVFRCLAEADPEYGRPKFRPQPNVVIENRTE